MFMLCLSLSFAVRSCFFRSCGHHVRAGRGGCLEFNLITSRVKREVEKFKVCSVHEPHQRVGSGCALPSSSVVSGMDYDRDANLPRRPHS
jgi:hypothetical protein